jgi:F-type H+-transporting ATPase subunit a
MLRKLSLLFLFVSANILFANTPEHSDNKDDAHKTEKTKSFDPVPMIMHHISDAHKIHWWGEGHESVSWPLPVILWTNNGLVTFMSSQFHHDDNGEQVAEKNGQKFVVFHSKIYYANETPNDNGQFIDLDEAHNVSSLKPIDISITKNVVGILFIGIILLLVFTSVARSYKKNGGVPRGLTGWMEPMVVFIRDEVAKPNIGDKKFAKYVPFLLTIFFFIWFLNMLGLTPLGFNITGNIAVTMVLAGVSLIVILISANKNYWKHIFWPPVPHALKPLMIPIEIVGIFTKPFALMIRLFANITAGHIVILSLVSLIFIAQNASGTAMGWAVSPGSLLLVLFISVLEILVALLQAYIFTLLTALFIGMAVEESH